jgi:hypothetical protein
LRNKRQTITIDDVSYTEDQLTDQQKVMPNHIGDLDRKIRSTQFNLDQLQMAALRCIYEYAKDIT